MGITQGQAFQSDYVNKEDCPLTAIIDKVQIEMVGGDEQQKERKAVICSHRFPQLPGGGNKRLIVNKSNWITIEEAYGPDSDMWLGKPIELYVDPSIMYGGKRVGGLRVRVPQGQQQAPAQGQSLGTSVQTQPGISWTEAQTRAAAVGIDKAALIAGLQAGGFPNWQPGPCTPLVMQMIAAKTAGQGSSDTGFGEPDDGSGIPF